MKRLINIVLLTVTIIVGSCFVGAALGGRVDPRFWSWPGVLAMTFPIWAIALVIVTVLTIVARSWISLCLCVLAWIIGHSGVKNAMPLNTALKQESDDTPTLSLLTYNVYGFRDFSGNPIEGLNPTVSAILASGASVVAIQECVPLEKSLPMLGYTSSQVDSIKKAYPYRSFKGNSMGILSRYPISEIKISEKPDGSAVFAGWRIDVDGLPVDLYSVHLQSFELNGEDKQLYRNLTDGGDFKRNVKEARQSLLPKVASALRSHADEGEMLERIITADTCRRVILCGDFNDVAGSYVADYIQSRCNMRSAWADSGSGFTWTYRVNRFYFHIDHIFYRGTGRPIHTRRLRTGVSDHYPLETVFQL